MGMYDESWCCGCGRSIPYTEDESAQCADCVQVDFDEHMKKYVSLIEYMKIHKISLEQDLEEAMYVWRTNRDNHDSSKIDYLNGSIGVLSHILGYANGLDSSRLEMVE